MKERIYFHGSNEPTIGVEVELFLVNPETFELEPIAPEILEVFGESPRVKRELLKSIVEVNTKVCKNVSEVREDLTKTISEIVEVADKMGYAVMSMGTHPFAKWEEQEISELDRYQSLIERFKWTAKRLLITGVHVHIGVESGEKAIAVTNNATRYIPHMIAISANTPIYDSNITGLASTRTKIFEQLPTTGLPHFLHNYSEFQKFMRTLINAKTINSIKEVWWDIRPHPGFGTVEMRTYDAVPTISEMTNLAAFTQCLVVGISNDYDNATQLPLLDRWINSENKWRATRYGLDAEIIINDNGEAAPLKDEIIKTIDKLLPVAHKLNCVNELLELREQVEEKRAPYLRQLELYENEKDLKKLVGKAVEELKSEI